MKKLLGVLLLGFVVAFNSSAAPTSAEQLRSEFEAALKAGDTNAILSLVNWQGVSNKTNGYVNILTEKLSAFLLKYKCPTNSIHTTVYLQPMRENEEAEGVVNGFCYRPNVSVKGMIQFDLSVLDNGTNVGDGAQIPYGETNGFYYLAGIIAEKLYEPKVKETPFQILVTTTNSARPTAYSISYVYTQNNKKVEKSFTGTNTFYKFIFANEVKSCVLRKLSDDGNSLKLEITELSTNKNPIHFDSETSSTNTPVIYESKQL
jgi:hypothetical protein